MEADVSTQPVTGHRSFRIHWVVQGIFGSERDGFTSELATNRYRAIIPAQQLRIAGHLVDFIAADGWQWGSGSRPDLIILGKLLPSGSAQEFSRMSSQVLAQATRAIADGVPVIADFNDDHFNHPVLGPHWVHAASLATLCTAASQAMADVVQRFTRSPVVVIPDPIASPTGTPRVFRPATGLARLLSRWIPVLGPKRLKLVWYGHPSNWPAMESWGSALEALSQKHPLLLWVVTKSAPQVLEWIAEFNLRNAPTAIAEWVEWSEEAQWSHVNDADAVLLPSDPSDPRLGVKSSNRLTDALNVGRYVVASVTPSYMDYEDYCSLTDEPITALESMTQYPEASLEKISKGQTIVRERVSASAVAKVWGDAVKHAIQALSIKLSDARCPSAAPSLLLHDDSRYLVNAGQLPAIRLNLGCGDKILDGYINVDVAPSRGGRSPDILCDIRKLNVFESDYADEVLAVHAVEHFWRWEVEHILRDWVRVLKPGGKLILECPNLITACQELLKDPEKYAQPTQEGQRTMWVFYGDPAWKDPLMTHRWAYTPESLSQLLKAIGLKDVQQEAAQFKLREPRDMRISGRKAPA